MCEESNIGENKRGRLLRSNNYRNYRKVTRLPVFSVQFLLFILYFSVVGPPFFFF